MLYSYPPETIDSGAGVVGFLYRFPFMINFKNIKRSITPTVTIYSNVGTINTLLIHLIAGNTNQGGVAADPIGNWVQISLTEKSAAYNVANGADVVIFSGPVSSAKVNSNILLQYVCDARLGLIP